MGSVWSRIDLTSDRLIWLLTITFAGRDFRFSTEPISVTQSRPADTIRYDGGLEQLTVSEALAVVSEITDVRTVPLEILWPDDLAGLIADGHDFAAATGELALIVRGLTFEERVVVISGRVSQPSYGGSGEAIAFSLVENPLDDVNNLLDVESIISAASFSTVAAEAVGKYAPIIIGAPGLIVGAPGATQTPGSPTLCIGYDTGTNMATSLLIAGHRVTATSVKIVYKIDEITFASATLNVAYTADLVFARTMAYVDVSAQSAAFRSAGQWWCIWSQGGGGMQNPFRPGVELKYAGDIMRWLALKSSVRCDLARFAAVADLYQWEIGCFIDDPCGPLKWMQERLLPLLPVSLASSSAGLYPVPWRYNAERSECVDTLTVGAGVSRTGRIEYEKEPGDIVSSIRVAWAYSLAARDFRKETVLTPEPNASDPLQWTDAFCKSSALRYGTGRTARFECDLLWHSYIVSRLLHWKIRSIGFSPRLVELEVGQEYAYLELGAPVLYTDAEVSIDRTVALVVGRGLSDAGSLTLQLQILDDLATGLQTSAGDDDAPRWNGGN